MPVTFELCADHPKVDYSIDGGTYTERFVVKGSNDVTVIMAATTTFGTLLSFDHRVWRMEHKTLDRCVDFDDIRWFYTQEWRLVEGGVQNAGGVVLEFDLTQGTAHLEVAYKQDAYRPPSVPPAPPYNDGNLIEQDGDQVKGCDIIRPDLRITATDTVDKSSFTSAYIQGVYDIRGTVNLNNEGIFPAKCGLFLGANFRYVGATRVERRFDFVYARPETRSFDISVLGATNVTRGAFDYVWFTKDREELNAGSSNGVWVLNKIQSVHVAQVYDWKSWAALSVNLSMP